MTEWIMTFNLDTMSNDNRLILETIKTAYEKTGHSSRAIKLPRSIDFVIKDDTSVKMKLPSSCISANMQSNESAFEGWALVLKRWGKFDKIIVDWEENKNSKFEGHYQRFLFRIEEFKNLFPDWFEIDDACAHLLDALKTKIHKCLLLNQAGERKALDYEKLKGEVKLEYEFVCGGRRRYLMGLCKAKSLDRQFPVGVFHDDVGEGYEIFTTRKSAIDIWGISEDGDLLIFELKTAKNISVGIITELLFYCNVMQNLKDCRFHYKDPADPTIGTIRKTSKIKAYFLVPRLHPLVDETLVQMLNFATVPKIEFDYIWFDTNAMEKVEFGFGMKP